MRNANPVFTLTWMIMHSLDDTSPLAHWQLGVDPPDHSEIIVVLSGTDERSGQTIQGAGPMRPSDIRWNPDSSTSSTNCRMAHGRSITATSMTSSHRNQTKFTAIASQLIAGL